MCLKRKFHYNDKCFCAGLKLKQNALINIFLIYINSTFGNVLFKNGFFYDLNWIIFATPDLIFKNRKTLVCS